MLSKNQVKSVTALHTKKFRDAEKLFIAEGEKIFAELAGSNWKIESVFCTKDFAEANLATFKKEAEVHVVSEGEMDRISTLKTPQRVLAVVRQKETGAVPRNFTGLNLILDGIQDPGNMGTILRIGDWFGVETIVCSPDTVECYNPKVVQASMGSILRMNVFYTDLPDLLKSVKGKIPVCGMTMNGKDLYKTELASDIFIVLGNESAGIGKDVAALLDSEITIPVVEARRQARPESLNVSVAAGIVCAEFARRMK